MGVELELEMRGEETTRDLNSVRRKVVVGVGSGVGRIGRRRT